MEALQRQIQSSMTYAAKGGQEGFVAMEEDAVAEFERVIEHAVDEAVEILVDKFAVAAAPYFDAHASALGAEAAEAVSDAVRGLWAVGEALLGGGVGGDGVARNGRGPAAAARGRVARAAGHGRRPRGAAAVVVRTLRRGRSVGGGEWLGEQPWERRGLS